MHSLLFLAASKARAACLGRLLPACSRQAHITVDIPCVLAAHLAYTGLQVSSGQAADGAVRYDRQK